jgi:hypothetical protein
MSFTRFPRAKLILALGASAFLLLYALACSLRIKPKSSGAGLHQDPILTIGHGSFINHQGEAFTPDVDFIVGLQAYYIEMLQARLSDEDKGPVAAEAQRVVITKVLPLCGPRLRSHLVFV